MAPAALKLLTFWLFLFISHTCARNNASSEYIALDIYYGTPQAPCTNSLNGWSPSLAALKDPRKCYGIDGDHNITCISRRMNRLDDDERMIWTAPLDCRLAGYANNDCAGPTYWPAQFSSANQSWTWAWDQSVVMVDIGSFGIVCR